VSRDIILPYGDSTITGAWPGEIVHVRSRGIEPIGDPVAAVRDALARPIGSPALVEAARGARTATVIVSDHTRETAARTLVPAAVEQLILAGIPVTRITILVAYGNHGRVSDEIVRSIIGDVDERIAIAHHDSRDGSQLAELGTLPSGATLRANRRAVEADVLVVTGAITFHYHAGFTGGRKAILPGIAACENILANHARTLGGPGADANGGRDPNCQPGRLAGNPVSEEMDGAARMLADARERAPFLINSVLTEDGDLAAVFAGDVHQAHRAGAAFTDERFRYVVDRPFDVAFASAGGYPRDGSFYQAHKALDHAARAVRDGGAVVLAAECRGGPGAGFLEWFDHASYGEHLSALEQSFAVPGQTALALRQKLGRIRGILVSGMETSIVERMGLIPAASLDGALNLVRETVGSMAKACVMPHASMVLPSVGE
jgi:nickel-dependent lactate racemase